jgi:hypothetical protein
MFQEEVDDQTLTERVRSKVGRVTPQLSALQIRALNGRITVSGQVSRGEAKAIVAATAGTPGVREVENRLEANAEGHGFRGYPRTGLLAASMGLAALAGMAVWVRRNRRNRQNPLNLLATG